MANTAEHQVPENVVPLRKPATPESNTREELVRELGHRCAELAALKDDWDGEGAHTPPLSLVKKAFDLGQMIVGTMEPMPSSLNISASPDGHILFSLFGAGGREADVWLEDESNNVFKYVATERELEHEGELAIANFARLSDWLAGRPALI